MKPQELKKNLEHLQRCSLQLIICLAAHNKDIAAMITAMEEADADAFSAGVKAFTTSVSSTGNALNAYCHAADDVFGGTLYGK